MPLASRRKEIKWGNDARKGSGNPNFTGGKYMDDKGYLRVLVPDHPFNNAGYVYEHRLVIEAILGRYLQPWETIHHINEIKLDNRKENLFLTTIPEHSIIHREGKRKTLEQKTHMRNKVREREKVSPRKRTANGKFESSDPAPGEVVV
jgi:hypothetical protein